MYKRLYFIWRCLWQYELSLFLFFFHNKHEQVSTCSDVTPRGLWMFAVNESMAHGALSYYWILWEHISNDDNVYKFYCFTKITSNKWSTKSKPYCFTTMNHIVFLLPVSKIMYWQDKHQRIFSFTALRMVAVEWTSVPQKKGSGLRQTSFRQSQLSHFLK